MARTSAIYIGPFSTSSLISMALISVFHEMVVEERSSRPLSSNEAVFSAEWLRTLVAVKVFENFSYKQIGSNLARQYISFKNLA
jgi:hypothetical protein